MARPGRALTRSGEPVKRKTAMIPEPKDKLDAATASVGVVNGPEGESPSMRASTSLGSTSADTAASC
jgi:hypothetical protein